MRSDPLFYVVLEVVLDVVLYVVLYVVLDLVLDVVLDVVVEREQVLFGKEVTDYSPPLSPLGESAPSKCTPNSED